MVRYQEAADLTRQARVLTSEVADFAGAVHDGAGWQVLQEKDTTVHRGLQVRYAAAHEATAWHGSQTRLLYWYDRPTWL